MRVTSSASSRRERRQDRRQPPREHRLAGARAGPPAAGCGRRRRRSRARAAAAAWPRTSARSGAGRRRAPRRRLAARRRRRRVAAEHARRPRAELVDAGDLDARRRAPPRARARAATIEPPQAGRGGRPRRRRARRGTARSSPPSDSSPKTAQASSGVGRHLPARGEHADGERRGRSPGPPCAGSAGARFAVMRRCGNSKPELQHRGAHALARLAHRRVGRARRSVNAGSPGRMSTSTQTWRGSMPSMANVATRASMAGTLRRDRVTSARRRVQQTLRSARERARRLRRIDTRTRDVRARDRA